MHSHFLSSFWYLLKGGIRNTWANRLMSIASIAVLTSCLFLMGAASLVSVNIRSVMGWLETQNMVKVFIEDGTDAARVKEIGIEIESLPNISKCEFVSSDEALADMLDNTDDDIQVIAELQGGDNPLPDAYRVTIANLDQYDETIANIGTVSGIMKISDKSDYAAKLNSINQMVSLIGIAIVSLLFVVSLFIITNTIKLTMYVRKLEISIMKSVGATNWFIRFPFMIEGMIIGLVAALIAFFITWGVYEVALDAFAQTINSLALMSFRQIMWMLAGGYAIAGIIIGSFGSGISIGKYLKREGGIYLD